MGKPFYSGFFPDVTGGGGGFSAVVPTSGIYDTGSNMGFRYAGVTFATGNSTSLATAGGVGLTANGLFIASAGMRIDPQTTITSAGGTVTGTDVVVPVDPSGGATAITLTAGDSYRLIIFKNITSSTNVITITPSAGLINGAANITMTTGYQCRHIWFNGTDYFTLN
jgi:hypothetical protein